MIIQHIQIILNYTGVFHNVLHSATATEFLTENMQIYVCNFVPFVASERKYDNKYITIKHGCVYSHLGV